MEKTKVILYFKVPPAWHRAAVEADPERVEETLMHYGARRWVPEERPPGGWKFPLANHENFPWEIIGAHRHTFTDEQGRQQTVVYWMGEPYKQRVFEANPNKNLPAAVKYSRGARPGDPPEIIEDDGSGFQYVTLITFRGDGKAAPLPKSRKPGATTAAPAAGDTLEERYQRARERLAQYAQGLSSDAARENLRKIMQQEGLATPPKPLSAEFVERYEKFVGSLTAEEK